MSGDDAQELRDTTIRHDERIRVVEDAISEQKPMLQAIQLTLGQLSSYNIEVASGLRKAIEGNGQPGLKQQCTELRATIEARKGVHDKEISRIHNILCWGGITLFAVMAGIIGWLIPTLVKHVWGG